MQDFSKIAEAAAKVFDGENPSQFTNVMSETLQNLNKSSEAIQVSFIKLVLLNLQTRSSLFICANDC